MYICTHSHLESYTADPVLYIDVGIVKDIDIGIGIGIDKGI